MRLHRDTNHTLILNRTANTLFSSSAFQKGLTEWKWTRWRTAAIREEGKSIVFLTPEITLASFKQLHKLYSL